MPRAERAVTRFVEAMLAGAEAGPDGRGDFVTGGTHPLRLPAAEARRLVSEGVLRLDGDGRCRLTGEASSWVLRRTQEADGFARQHRLPWRDPDGSERNLAESPLGRLASARPGEVPFLAPHQVEAGERVRRLIERARLRQRTTMRYTPRSGGGRGGAADLPDFALDARRLLDEIARLLPPDCAGVVFDVCGLLKGLQEVEQERGWPRRSAKLVLRIGLEQLAQHFGLATAAQGPETTRQRVWVSPDGRPRGVY